MDYILAQAFGILATVCCFIAPLFKRKWQMLINSAVANILTAVNFIMLGELGTGIIMNLIAVVQIIFSLWHILKNTKVTLIENIVFFIPNNISPSLYVGFIELPLTKHIEK